MQIIWYGHSCFLIKTRNGKRILMDPFDNSLGYRNDFPKCDIITMSHHHSAHSYLNNINYDTKIINVCDSFNLNSIKITGIETFHDDCSGLKRGSNIVFLFNIDGLSLCHLGDLGHIPSCSILNKLKNLDVLFIPIGGNFTIDGNKAYKICSLIKPKFIIPMHYKTNTLRMNLDDCKNFLIKMPLIEKLQTNTLQIDYISDKTLLKTLLLKCPSI
ncbi:MAG: MBL fold metallo-hydrolase [Clostridium sp.]|nr:MBL fold metallo-hydrolase [Clostridium sp.]